MLNALVGGWQVNTVFTWQSGLPFTPSYRDCNADRDTGWCRPDLVGEWKPENQTADAWFVTTPLGADGRVTPLTANGQTLGPWRRPERATFGTVGPKPSCGVRRSGSGTLSFFKNIAVTDSVRAQFRAEVVQHPEPRSISRIRTPAWIVRAPPDALPTSSSWPPCVSGSSACGWNSDPSSVTFRRQRLLSRRRIAHD